MPQFRLVPRDRADAVHDTLEVAYVELAKIRNEAEAMIGRIDVVLKTIEDTNFNPRRPYADRHYRGTGK